MTGHLAQAAERRGCFRASPAFLVVLWFCGFPSRGGESQETKAPPVAAPQKKTDKKASGDTERRLYYWGATKIVADGDRVVLVRSPQERARVHSGEITISADLIVVNLKLRDVYAEGGVRLVQGATVVFADLAYYCFDQDTGYLLNAEVRASGRRASGLARPDRPSQAVTSAPATADPKSQQRRQPGPPVASLPETATPAEPDLLVARAQRLIRRSRTLFAARGLELTTCQMASPLWKVTLADAELTCREQPDPGNPQKTTLTPAEIRGNHAVFVLFGLPLFYFPYLGHDVGQEKIYYGLELGRSRRWGPFVFSRVGVPTRGMIGENLGPERVYLDLDYRQDRGVAPGAEVRYRTGEKGQGRVQGYYLREDLISSAEDAARGAFERTRRTASPLSLTSRRAEDEFLLAAGRRAADGLESPTAETYRYADTDRYSVRLDHRQELGLDPFGGAWVLDASYDRFSDRDFFAEYFYHDYLTDRQPEDLLWLRVTYSDLAGEMLYRRRPERFEVSPRHTPLGGEFTEYEPQAVLGLAPRPLWGGFLLEAEAGAGRCGRKFDPEFGFPDTAVDRAFFDTRLRRPLSRWGFTLNPFVGTAQRYYDDSREDRPLHQGALLYGGDCHFRGFLLFPSAGQGADETRYFFQPGLEYEGIGETISDPLAVYDADDRDDLRRKNRLRYYLRQRLQAGGGDGQPRDLLGANVHLDYYPEPEDRRRLAGGHATDFLESDLFFAPLSWLRLDTHLSHDLEEGGRLMRLANSLTASFPGSGMSFSASYRYLDLTREDRSSILSGVLRLDLSSRWHLACATSYQFNDSPQVERRFLRHSLEVKRDFGGLELSFAYSMDALGKQGFGYVNFRLKPMEPHLVFRPYRPAEAQPAPASPTADAPAKACAPTQPDPGITSGPSS